MMRKNKFAILLLINITTSLQAEEYLNVKDGLISDSEIFTDGQNAIREIGQNCADPTRLHLNIMEFVNETKNLISGLSELSSELAIQTGNNRNYPNICHVFTQAQRNTYKEEWIDAPVEKNQGVVSAKTVKVSYYWPKYQIEVMERGNDFASEYIENNSLFSVNRAIAEKLLPLYDVTKISSIKDYITGGLEGGALSQALSPIERLRITGTGSSTGTHLESNIWPIASSYTVASRLTVCGPEREEMGINPGGIKWPFRGVPMTCPLSTSLDLYPYWDTGVLDFINPRTIKNIFTSSDIKTCAIDYSTKLLAELAEDKVSTFVPTELIAKKTEGLSGTIRKALLGCSFPVLGDVEALVSTFTNVTSIGKWRELGCTPWGPLYPRMGRFTFKNDFVYANAALRFKLLSNDLMGVERGQSERWSLSYPWEKRAYGLYIPGSVALIDSSVSVKHQSELIKKFSKEYGYASQLKVQDSVTALGLELSRQGLEKKIGKKLINGDRRIYTIWEKIKCVYPVKKLTIKTPIGITYSKYDSCRSAIKMSVYKNFQQNILPKICTASAMTEGAPWK
ncbi:MAG: hypothetical protein COV57_03050 [Candidatus Liptonbacteria bacterium CG11_big_fil_rev_8_21_14_0_20_35_14]|uniref:Uncharacterized protein n=1 Tax=Candidatus Liptonbacteria bacterium CG11_big_fil_rev_8_21_14_0_20_35_14 TaxID=1974634 RepID=A0A2H0N703_9BACT|nr:MAG: hypothetical protein COV57_03050 [Candidatus Liptonbacteria bacterium CG11_big_fil_rev_8_21_14_0_20_35_14]